MQFLDNHMDDLFQRAAEKFPLREPDDDWANIQSKLNTPVTPAATENHKKKNIFIGVLVVLCLYIPYSLFDSGYLGHQYDNTPSPVIINEGDKANTKREAKSQRPMATTAVIIPQTGNGIHLFNHPNKVLRITPDKNEIGEPSLKANTIVKGPDTITGIDHGPEPVKETLSQMALPEKEEQDSHYDLDAEKKQMAIASGTNHPQPDTVAPAKAKSTMNTPANGWYAGIHAGMSMSIVKGQDLSSPGFAAGLTLGYRFAPSWSVETGVTFSEKKYYSKGAYFSTKNMPPDMEIVSVQGKTLLWEIPVKAKYDFRKSANGQFFLTGGISNFIVGKEVNDYIIYRNGINSPMHAVYPENQLVMAAAFEMSGGFEKYFKNKQLLRIEPWIQIARKGIGVGQLPVSGFGIRAGYFFHK